MTAFVRSLFAVVSVAEGYEEDGHGGGHGYGVVGTMPESLRPLTLRRKEASVDLDDDDDRRQVGWKLFM